jgi:hypothetical protein
LPGLWSVFRRCRHWLSVRKKSFSSIGKVSDITAGPEI